MELPPNSEVNLTPDLEAARDEKVVPAARDILADMVTDLMVENPDAPGAYNPLLLKILQKMLDTDMNITMEAQYVFQLLLGAFSGLNTTLHSLELAPTDDARYIAIAKKVLGILSEANVRFTKVTPEETAADFAEAKIKLQTLFTEEKLTKLELRYIMDNVFESVKTVNNSISEALAQSTDKAEAKVFGIGSMSELTLGNINKILVNDITVTFAKPVVAVPPEGQVEPVAPPAGDGQVAPPTVETEAAAPAAEEVKE